jgi:multidrug transporter EmrE-like cation transporter
MSGRALALVLGAAAIHAAWNALAKKAHHPIAFLWSSVVIATAALGPFGLRYLPEGGIPDAAVPFVIATTLIHAVYFYALARAYGSGGDLSLVYPIARGLGVALVPLVAFAVLDERPSPLGVGGVALVVVGIAAISLASTSLAPGGGEGGVRGRVFGRGTGWAVITGLTIAAYSLVDKAGVAHLHPLPYLVVLGAGISLLLAPAVIRAREAFVPRMASELARHSRGLGIEPHELSPRALRLPPRQGGLCGGGARVVHRAVGADRRALARRARAGPPARRRRGGRGGRGLRGSGALTRESQAARPAWPG